MNTNNIAVDAAAARVQGAITALEAAERKRIAAQAALGASILGGPIAMAIAALAVIAAGEEFDAAVSSMAAANAAHNAVSVNHFNSTLNLTKAQEDKTKADGP